MGYEIKLIIGRAATESDEFARSTERYDDDSGFKYLKDENGEFVRTGRKEHFFIVYAELDLCKLGYQDDPLNRLVKASKARAKEMQGERFYYFYGTGSNEQNNDDPYGDYFWPVPVQKVLEAVKASIEPHDPYRRLTWAIALLESMAKDAEVIEVLFYGH